MDKEDDIYICIYIYMCIYKYIYIYTYIYIYIYIMKHYSAIKQNEILSIAKMQMDLECIMLAEIRQKKKDSLCYYLYVESKK